MPIATPLTDTATCHFSTIMACGTLGHVRAKKYQLGDQITLDENCHHAAQILKTKHSPCLRMRTRTSTFISTQSLTFCTIQYQYQKSIYYNLTYMTHERYENACQDLTCRTVCGILQMPRGAGMSCM